jgi:quercetin dioxygenase-like cupin family protein
MKSSCELSSRPTMQRTRSEVLRFESPADPTAPFRWLGVAPTAYKADAEHHRGVMRTALIGEAGEKMAFHVRYFEIAPGGFSTLEQHEHIHAVVILRGKGEVVLGDVVHELGFGDTVYVAPQEAHQFRNASGEEPFGFLCMVDAERDRPVVLAK